MTKKRILTGDRPTGSLHLGHYVGSIQNRVKLQNEGNEVFTIISDFQYLTDRLETKDVEQNTIGLLLDYLACGINPDKSVIFIQSRVPALAELFVYLSMLVSVSRAQQNPTVKEEVRATAKGKMSLGMLSFPVSQAADILAFDADLVPVGED
ncbi:MAG: tryptophan--tRNA ligase, partial [Patescibacteria group bacterium]